MKQATKGRAASAAYPKSEVLAVYDKHPLQERTILDRVLTRQGRLTQLSEIDLAVDSTTEITDQNHIGGLTFVKELGTLSGVNSRSRVLDLGSGLGGSARALALNFGCRVHGIDFSPKRHREARRLTRLVGLGKLVSFQCADIETVDVPTNSFDVLWGQSAWAHVRDKRKFIRRWSNALKKGGRVAMEDAFLMNRPRTDQERAWIADLEYQWKAYLTTVDAWREILTSESFVITSLTDQSKEMYRYYKRLMAALQSSTATNEEASSWSNALRLHGVGVLVYYRIVAEKHSKA
jgi:cyclopropane fatty-acyl-phospholipid synthase-like methyltransferase